jgi:hypothetical protein
MAKNTIGDCGICCESLNKSTRKIITCPCGFSSCMNCCKTYLLSLTSEPKCMNCNRGWTPEFIITNMSRSFYLKELRQHMAGILLEKEKSSLPSAQPEAENLLRIKKLEKEYIEIKTQYDNLHEIVENVKNLEYYPMLLNTDRKEDEFQILKKEYLDYSHGLYDLKLKKDEIEYTIKILKNGSTNKVQNERKKFMMHCRTSECRGFLSTQWKCSLCEKYTCNNCMESIGDYENKETHECKKENIESAELIRRESKPCPACGVPIYRIIGCSNMFCVECHTGFNWITMKIQTGKIDNPHYFEWKNKGGGMSRRAGDLPCGGLPDQLNMTISLSIGGPFYKLLVDLIPSIAHISNVVMPRFEPIGEATMMSLRIKFLMNELTEDQWKAKLANIQKTNSFRHCVNQVLEMYTNTMVTLYQNLAQASDKEIKNKKWCLDKANEIILLYAYADKELRKINSIYKQKIPFLIEVFNMRIIIKCYVKKVKGKKISREDIEPFKNITLSSYWCSEYLGFL